MTKAIWAESAKTSEIGRRISASTENIPCDDSDLAEFTNLERPLRD